MVFGGPGVGGSGNVSLVSLNGANGFKLDGENNHDFSGLVSAAGDINGDGIADLLISASYYPNSAGKGRSYVVLGDPPPVLVNNSLSLSPAGARIALQSVIWALMIVITITIPWYLFPAMFLMAIFRRSVRRRPP